MTEMQRLFVAAFGLGMAICAPPGVITAEALRRGLARGFRPALLVELGSLIGDATWAALALAGAAFLAQSGPARLALGLVGVFFLFRLAWGALRDARSGVAPQGETITYGGDFTTGAFLSLSNPLALGFWLGVGGAIGAAGIAAPRQAHFAVFFAGFMLACLIWCFFVAGLAAGRQRFVRPAFFRLANGGGALALALFGLKLLWELARPLL